MRELARQLDRRRRMKAALDQPAQQRLDIDPLAVPQHARAGGDRLLRRREAGAGPGWRWQMRIGGLRGSDCDCADRRPSAFSTRSRSPNVSSCTSRSSGSASQAG